MSGNGLSYELLMQIVRMSPDGVVVCQRSAEGWPVAYANDAFEQLTGYSRKELLGHDLRMLQGTDREQENRQKISSALSQSGTCRVLMRNYRKDGSQFWNEMSLVPVKDNSGNVTHYVGFHRDASERLRFEPKAGSTQGQGAGFMTSGAYPSLLSVMRDDRVTGLFNRAYFDELMRRDWAIAQRDGRRLTLILFDIDSLGSYNDTFGRSAGDACLKRVARTIAGCLKRSSDLSARLEGGTIAALVHGMTVEQAEQYANVILDKVREQRIHHPRSNVQRYVTITAGIVNKAAGGEEKPDAIIERARAVLKDAKAAGRNRAIAVSE